VDIRPELGVEFTGFTPRYSNPPSFEIEPPPVEVVVVVPVDTPKVEIDIPGPPPSASPVINLTIGDTFDITGFSEAGTSLSNQMRAQLDQYIKYLKENPNLTLRVEGHSDNRGNATQNNQRATDRAAAVNRYLVQNGIRQGRIF